MTKRSVTEDELQEVNLKCFENASMLKACIQVIEIVEDRQSGRGNVDEELFGLRSILRRVIAELEEIADICDIVPTASGDEKTAA